MRVDLERIIWFNKHNMYRPNSVSLQTSADQREGGGAPCLYGHQPTSGSIDKTPQTILIFPGLCLPQPLNQTISSGVSITGHSRTPPRSSVLYHKGWLSLIIRLPSPAGVDSKFTLVTGSRAYPS